MSYATHISAVSRRGRPQRAWSDLSHSSHPVSARPVYKPVYRAAYLLVILLATSSPGPKFGAKRTARITSDLAGKPTRTTGNSSERKRRDSMSGCWEIGGACYLQVSRCTKCARSDLGAVDRPIGSCVPCDTIRRPGKVLRNTTILPEKQIRSCLTSLSGGKWSFSSHRLRLR